MGALRVYDLAGKGAVEIMPFVRFRAHFWNTGISYGWFQQEAGFGQWALLSLKTIAVMLLWIWLARAGSRASALALGLIMGGAIGNAMNRVAYGAVADFVLLRVETATWRFNWYVFNLADVAIVAGVAVLLLEIHLGGRCRKSALNSGNSRRPAENRRGLKGFGICGSWHSSASVPRA